MHATSTDIFVARQPIFDRRQEVYGYELLFRSGLDNAFHHDNLDQASFEMLHTTLLGFGLDVLLGDRVGFVNASREVLLQEFYLVLPRERTVIELIESVEPCEEVVAACQGLKRAGYRLALDDFVRRPVRVHPFSGILLLPAGGALRRGCAGLQPELRPVHRRAELSRAGLRPAGGDHQAGGCPGREVASLPQLGRLRLAARGDLDQARIAGAGRAAARKWCSLMALTVLGEERPSQLVVSSLVRAQFAEQVGMEGGPRSRGVDLFLTGMLSTLDVLIGRPMEEALSQIPVSQEIRDTLLGRTTTLSPTWATTRQQDNKATRRGVDIAWSPRRLVAHSHALPLAQATSFRYTSRSASLKHTNRTSSIAGR
jgi:hypothetical protein